MRVPLSWLRDYVAIAVPLDELAARLATSTCEVERIAHRGVPDVDRNLDHFRVGRVVDVGAHPNADRIRLCHVDVGERELREIVCGAWNFEVGATVCVVLPGGILPGGLRIEQREVRGVRSDGMILSEQELELGQDHSGILVLSEPAEPGQPLGDLFAIGDDVIEVEVTGNRPDLLSVYGLAREVAALFGLELAPPPGEEPARAADEPVDVRVEDPDGCPVYIGRLFRDVSVGPSPPWLKARLVASGLRPISNVVDVTNYVMHIWGSPLHAFDRGKLTNGRIVVRRARTGEELRTLDGIVRRLDADDLLITDGDHAVALAAIMGGEDSEVTDDTRDVLLEAANFEPLGILRSSERLALRTAGSNRWEKGVDPYLAENAAVLASRLLVDLTGARMTGHVDVNAGLPERPVVRLRPERASRVIGLEVPSDEQRSTLRGFGFEVAEDWNVTVPTWRARDVTREIDLVEEVARPLLDRIPYRMPLRRHVQGRLTKDQRIRRLVEDILVGTGLSEAYTWSLVPWDPHPEAIRLPSPMTSDQAILRTTVIPGLVEAAKTALDAGADDVGLFEIARVYYPSGEQLPNEAWHAGGVVQGGFENALGVVETLYDSLHVELRVRRGSNALLHPGKAAETDAGWLGELHPTLLEGPWGAFEIDLGALAASVPERIVYEDVITYPAVLHDIAVAVAEDVEVGALVDAAHEVAGPLLREARVFDVYRGEQVGAGRKSVAIHLSFQSPERTLTDDEAGEVRDRIVAALAERFEAELRA
ncbi:MAG TPA: phenylalanine--tRNA ligase subunit beta [Gaiellaceae bacterium]|nr:phenylalanine--tRNA ligase subunit beta [Gaiellaceae bacterium]